LREEFVFGNKSTITSRIVTTSFKKVQNSIPVTVSYFLTLKQFEKMAFIGPTPYYIGIAMYFIGSIVLGSCLVFHILALLGIFVKIRKEQDKVLMYLLTAMNFCGFLHTSFLLNSLMYTPSVNCRVFQFGGTFFYAFLKPLLFLFLARKAILVQYSGNAAKWAFRLDYSLIVIFFAWELGLMFYPGLENFTHFTDPNNHLAMCIVAFSSSTPTVSTVLETIINLLNLGIFLAPLRAHQLESKNTTSMAGSNSKPLGDVIKRNIRGAACTIFFTFASHISAIVISDYSHGNIGLATIDYGLVCFDETIAVLCVMYVCHNAYVIPCRSTGDSKGVGMNVSGGRVTIDRTGGVGNV